MVVLKTILFGGVGSNPTRCTKFSEDDMEFKSINVHHEDIHDVIKLFNDHGISYVAGKHDQNDVVEFASVNDYDRGTRILESNEISFR